jgi:hypothetical protein
MSARRLGETRSSYSPAAHGFAPTRGRASSRSRESPAPAGAAGRSGRVSPAHPIRKTTARAAIATWLREVPVFLEAEFAADLLRVPVSCVLAAFEHPLARVRLVFGVRRVERIVFGREILGGIGIGHVAVLPLSARRKRGYRTRLAAINQA